MHSAQLLKQGIIIITFLSAFSLHLKSQDEGDSKYNAATDTLLVINKKIIDQYKVMMDRQDLVLTDTIKTNQKDLWITGFKISAITLGQDITLSSNSAFFTSEMINEIINGETKYKFIYLKDIILQSKDGRSFSPSTKNIKIIFSN